MGYILYIAHTLINIVNFLYIYVIFSVLLIYRQKDLDGGGTSEFFYDRIIIMGTIHKSTQKTKLDKMITLCQS